MILSGAGGGNPPNARFLVDLAERLGAVLRLVVQNHESRHHSMTVAIAMARVGRCIIHSFLLFLL